MMSSQADPATNCSCPKAVCGKLPHAPQKKYLQSPDLPACTDCMHAVNCFLAWIAYRAGPSSPLPRSCPRRGQSEAGTDSEHETPSKTRIRVVGGTDPLVGGPVVGAAGPSAHRRALE